MAGGAGFVSNFIFWQESGYFDNAAETKLLLHLWSLGVEEQFYILYPTLLWVAWKCHVNLLAVTLIIALVSFGLGLKVIQTDPVAAFYSPQTRFWELMLGAVLAYLALHDTRTVAKVRHTLDDWLSRLTYAHLLKENGVTLSNVQSWFGLALIGISIVDITKETRFPGGWALFPTLGAALLIAGGPQAWINRKFLSNRILVWFGLISFPLYLWHWVAVTFPRIVAGEYPSAGIRVAAVILSTILAWLTVVLVEKPLRFGKHNGTKVGGLMVLMIIVGYVGYLCNQGSGFPLRNAANPTVKNAGDLGHDKFVKYLSRKFFLCTPVAIRNDAVLSKGIRRCFQSKKNAPVDIALVGDSHAEHLFLGLAENLPRKNIAYYMKGGAPVIDNERFTKIFDYLIADKTIKKVIITAYWTHKGVTLARLLPTMRKLEAGGKQVIVTDDVPSFQFSPARCKYERLFIFGNRCLQERDSALRWNKLVYRHSREIVAQNPDVKIIYTSQYFCDSSYCFMGKNGKLLFRDEHHLSINGSKYVGERMVDDLPILND
jgi:peptidoglycan/LPS O-acetylase OafA/YrhL